jgi:hypothetical protein
MLACLHAIELLGRNNILFSFLDNYLAFMKITTFVKYCTHRFYRRLVRVEYNIFFQLHRGQCVMYSYVCVLIDHHKGAAIHRVAALWAIGMQSSVAKTI